MFEEALLQMLREIVFDNEPAFDNALGTSMSACVAMSMHAVLRLLHAVDHICNGLYILSFIRRYLLHTFVLPVDVSPVGHCVLIFSFIRNVHGNNVVDVNETELQRGPMY